MEFDHHCIFTNSCIGKRNKQYFVYFINLTAFISVLYAYAYVIWLWQMTYTHNIDEDNSNLLMITIIVPFIVVSYAFLNR